MFLRPHDYRNQIQVDNLNKVQGSDNNRLDAEEIAMEEVRSLLSGRYDMSKVYKDVTVWESKSYSEGDIISLEADDWDSTVSYSTGDLVGYNEEVWEAQTNNTDSEPSNSNSDWDSVGKRDRIYVAQTDTSSNPESNDWELTDPRNPLIKSMVIDITLYHLHSRIQPRNIPQFRLDRRDEAITMLKEISEGKRVPQGLADSEPSDESETDVYFDNFTDNKTY